METAVAIFAWVCSAAAVGFMLVWLGVHVSLVIQEGVAGRRG